MVINVFIRRSGLGLLLWSSIGFNTGCTPVFNKDIYDAQPGTRVTDPSPAPPSTVNTPSLAQLESFQLATGQDASANAVAHDSENRLWVGGFALDQDTSMHWIVRTATDATASFTTSDDYQLNSNWDARVNAVATSSDGSIWAAGDALADNSISHWIVRSKASNGSWLTSDDYQLDAGFGAQASALVIDASGTVYVGGFASDSAGTQHWIVRKKVGSDPWVLIDDYQPGVGLDAFVTGLAFDVSHDVVYASGFQSTVSGTSAVVRQYSSGNWSTTDDFQLDSDQDSFNLGIAVDSSSNVYTIGYGQDTSVINHWITRILPWAGTWSTLDDDQLVSGQHSYGQAVAAGSRYVYTTGFEANSSSNLDWVIREFILGSNAFSQFEDLAGSSPSDNWLGAGVALDASELPYTVGARSDGTSTHWVVKGYK